MTIKELIKELKEYNLDAEVVVQQDVWEPQTIAPIVEYKDICCVDDGDCLKNKVAIII